MKIEKLYYKVVWLLAIALNILVFSKENAVILILCRNSDMKEINDSLKYFEESFNKAYGYPYVFLNDVEFTEEFKNNITNVVSTKIDFGKLDRNEWGYPPWIDQSMAEKAMKQMESNGVIYGGSLSYRHMCRFFSGFFYKNKLVRKYDYYWRIEPGVKFFCKMNYDPFEFMKKNSKEYGFVINIREYMQTIPTLWDTSMEFLSLNRNLIKNKGMNFMFENGNYNGCHFWSNFEIANLNFFRSEVYEKFFEFLDKKGGFYYERWGDAPVHSIAAALFLDKNKIHYFEDIGYEHPPFMHCPSSPSRQVDCKCRPEDSIDKKPFSCLKDFIIEKEYL